MKAHGLSRRQFIRLLGIGTSAGILIACEPRGRGEVKPFTPTAHVATEQKAEIIAVSEDGDWYVSPAGSPRGEGSPEKPWDIVTAFREGGYPSNSIKPGDVVMLGDGTYGSGYDTVFEINVSGATRNPVVFRPHPHAHVRIDGGIRVSGSNVRLSNAQGAEFEILNSNWVHADGVTVSRWFDDSESIPQKSAIKAMPGSEGLEVINLVIHDSKQGIADQQEAEPPSLHYGCLIQNCGYQSSDRGHGHGAYMQNQGPSVKRLRDMIFVHCFSTGVQWFGQDDGPVRSARTERCILVDRFLTFGSGEVKDAIVEDCVVWGGMNRFDFYSGFWWPTHHDITVRNNRVFHMRPDMFAIRHGPFQNATFTGNRIVTEGELVAALKPPHKGPLYPYLVDDNEYWSASTARFRVWEPGEVPRTQYKDFDFAGWKEETGYDSASSLRRGRPKGVEVDVYPNEYETGRANIVIHNWDEEPSVSVDLSGVALKSGEKYEIRNTLNYFGDTPIEGIFDEANSKVAIDMRAERWSFARPIAGDDGERASWPLDDWGRAARLNFPSLGAFIIRKAIGVG